MNKSRGRGRPRGSSTARADIVAVARRRFLADGYARVTLRSIATEAGVDPALISYYFGSKRGLFGVALELDVNPTVVAAQALDAPLEAVPERLVRSMLSVWDDPIYRAQLLRMISGTLAGADGAQGFREAIEREIFGRIAERVGGRSAQLRASAVTAQVAGLIFLRYVIQVEPFVSMNSDEVVAALVPGIRRALGLAPPR